MRNMDPTEILRAVNFAKYSFDSLEIKRSYYTNGIQHGKYILFRDRFGNINKSWSCPVNHY